LIENDAKGDDLYDWGNNHTQNTGKNMVSDAD